MEQKTILKVVVGSRLHGLHTEDSDFDYRGIHMSSLGDILSPFKKIKNRVWIEGDEDNTSYELTDFCKFAAQGNPTILETLWSDQIVEDSDVAKELRANRQKFLDSKRIFDAHLGYSKNQYKKMSLVNITDRDRKYCVAYIRSLSQGTSLLVNGEITPRVEEGLKYCLERIKEGSFDVNKIIEVIEAYTSEMESAFNNNQDKFKPDIGWIENFILEKYIHSEKNIIEKEVRSNMCGCGHMLPECIGKPCPPPVFDSKIKKIS